MDLQIFAITDPRELIVQPRSREVRATVRYLEPARHRQLSSQLGEHRYWLINAPRRYLSALWYTIRERNIDVGYKSSSRFDCFLEAVYLAWLIEDGARRTGRRLSHLHAHFAHDPTLIAFLVHRLTGIPYSFTAHARDLYQLPISELIHRADQATSVITCCDANVLYLSRMLPETLRTKIRLIHHGVDLQGFKAATIDHESLPPLILSIGRLVEKKGFLDLLKAFKILQQSDVRFRCEIYGEGPLQEDLEAFIQSSGLSEQVKLEGARTQQQLLPIYQRASIFALTPSITADGDRDGIPNVLVEAMACGLPVVSTAVGGIPELVHHNETGLLFKPHDAESIAAGLSDLLVHDQKRERLGRQARSLVSQEYDIHAAANQLSTLYTNTLQAASFQEGGW